MELMSSDTSQSFDNIVAALSETMGGMFAEDTHVKLAYLEPCSETDATLARLQIIKWG